MRVPVRSFAAVLTLALGSALPAGAATLPFTATLSVTVGTFPPVSATAAGVGTSVGSGAATLPGGVFSVGATSAISPALLNLIGAVAFCQQALSGPTFTIPPPGTLGSCAPNPNGTLGTLAFGGITGTASLLASAYLTNLVNAMGQAMSILAIPLDVIGVGGTASFVFGGGLVSGTLTGNPWQLGAATATGVLNGVTTTLSAAGSDARAGSGVGVLSLVTPALVDIAAVGSLPAIATLSVTYFVPEPATAALVAGGAVALACVGRRRGQKGARPDARRSGR